MSSALDPFLAILGRQAQMMQTPAQMRASARQMTSDSIAQSLAANNAMIQGQQQMYSRQAARAQGMAGALATATAPDPAQIATMYGQAADRTAAYGTGLTGAVGKDWADQAQAMKDRVAAVTGGLGQTHSYDPAAMQNAMQLSSVSLPSANLADQAAAAGAMAQYGRATSAANIGNIAQQYLQRQNDLQNQISAQSAALQAQRPGMERSALQQLAQMQNQNLATMTSGLGMASMMGYRQGTLQSKTWMNPSTGQIERIPSGATVVQNPTTGAQSLVPAPRASAPVNPATRAKAIQGIINTNTAAIDKLASGGPYSTVTNAFALGNKFEKTPQYKPLMPYAMARNGLVATLPPSLRTNPQMLARVDATLAKYGYKKTK